MAGTASGSTMVEVRRGLVGNCELMLLRRGINGRLQKRTASCVRVSLRYLIAGGVVVCLGRKWWCGSNRVGPDDDTVSSARVDCDFVPVCVGVGRRHLKASK